MQTPLPLKKNFEADLDLSIAAKLRFIANCDRPLGRNNSINLLPSDYENGDVLTDLVGDIELERLRVRLWNARTRSYNSVAEVWSSPKTHAEILAQARSAGAPNLREGLYVASRNWGGEAAQFGALKAKLLTAELVRLSGAAAAKIVDPCAGWGERCVGAMLTRNVAEYVGFDPNTALHPSYRLLGLLCAAERQKLGWPECRATFYEHASPLATDVAETLVERGSCDVAFTSPPYWTKELYSYGCPWTTLDDWLSGFFYPMLRWMWQRLRDGGILAIHISNYGQVDFIGPLNAFMSYDIADVDPNFTAQKLSPINLVGTSAYPRPVWIWRKIEKK